MPLPLDFDNKKRPVRDVDKKLETPDTLRQGFQKLLGSIIYLTSTFFGMEIA